MTSLYERIHEIKKSTGWSQQRISAETGLALSTIGRIFRVPGYTGNEISQRLIKRLHEEVVTSPFPAYMERLFDHYEDWKERYTKKEFAEHQGIVEALLLKHEALNARTLESCRACWLLGNVNYDRAFYVRRLDTITSAKKALDWYQRGLDILSLYPDKRLMVQRYKLQQCIVSTQFNSCDRHSRADNDKIRRWLVDLRYVQTVETVVLEDPWNWMAARNGLIAASILKQKEKCLLFWQAMKKVNKQFTDPDYVPSCDMPSINQDPDLAWFSDQLNSAERSIKNEIHDTTAYLGRRYVN